MYVITYPWPNANQFRYILFVKRSLNTLRWRHNGRDSISNHQPHHYSTIYSDADQRKHHSSASLAFVWGIHRGPVNSPHKWPVMRKMFPFDDVIMIQGISHEARAEYFLQWHIYKSTIRHEYYFPLFDHCVQDLGNSTKQIDFNQIPLMIPDNHLHWWDKKE